VIIYPSEIVENTNNTIAPAFDVIYVQPTTSFSGEVDEESKLSTVPIVLTCSPTNTGTTTYSLTSPNDNNIASWVQIDQVNLNLQIIEAPEVEEDTEYEISIVSTTGTFTGNK
jgi:aminoglycoside/choline kinase family phosphotransferase